MIETHTDDALIHECLAVIEKKLGWGNSSSWTKTDFEELSEIVQSETGVTLSVTTLKRVWGRVKYDNKPTVTTLNTLARFSGFKSWRTFVQHEMEKQVLREPTPPINRIEKVVEQKTKRPIKRSVSLSWILGIGIITLVFVTLFSFYNFNNRGYRTSNPAIDASKFSFSANKIFSTGVPNSVVFDYDATASPTDSVYIVQTWDIRRKTLVSKNDHHHSAIYYYPGYFNTKLIVDNTIVKRHDLQIATDGWLALADNDPVPIYFKKSDFVKDGMISVDKALLEKNNLSLLPHAPKIRFFNQGDLGNLMNDNFEFETTLKNEFREGDNACQYVEVLIQCKDDIIIIPLSAKACVGQIHLYVAGTEVQSRYADLSKFGCDLSQWNTLKVTCQDKHMKLFVNNVEAYALIFPDNPTGIVGVQYRFNGVGAVKDTKFRNKEREIQLQ